MLDIEIRTIPHKNQRYDTAGDYFIVNGTDKFRISDCGNWIFEVAIAIHELVEWAWVRKNNISIAMIDDFDIRFEEERGMGIHGPDDEPGDDPNAPYHRGHCFATAVERMVIAMLGESWENYCVAVESHCAHWKKPQKKGRKKS